MLGPWRANLSGYSRLLLARLFPRDYSRELARTAQCPPLLGIETTNICNADCVFCAYQYMERPKIIMDFDLYKKVIQDYAQCGGRNVGLAATVGDPLLDPRLLDRIAYGKSQGMQGFGFFTNGILLHKFDLHTLLTSGLGALHISLAGFDRETYHRTYRVDIYHRVIENVIRLRRLRAAGLPVEFAMRYDNWSGKIKPDDLLGAMRMRPVPRKKQPCSMLWFGATVHADGVFTVCGCRDLDGTSELALGNLKQHSLAELWTSERLQRIRREFTTRLPDICVDCAQYSPVSIIGSWHLTLISQIRPAEVCPLHA
ncbi:MAG: SPASM domain-containing protein [Acidobacteria bacterium]|nr:SPASM domain-containing protein [Acidobacteriota bacterium]